MCVYTYAHTTYVCEYMTDFKNLFWRRVTKTSLAYGILRIAYGTLRNPCFFLKSFLSLRNLTDSLRNLTEFERFAGFSDALLKK